MGIDYRNGKISGDTEPLIGRVLYIRDMNELSEGYCSTRAVLFDENTIAVVDENEICYSEGQISSDADPEDWLRVIRLVDTYLIDGSHQQTLRDDLGKFIVPLAVSFEWPYEAIEPVCADYIDSDMRLEAVANMLRDQYGFELARNIFLTEVSVDEDGGLEES